MSTKKVKKYASSLKAKVVLEAIKEEKTIAQIGSEFSINPFNVKAWKKQFFDNIEVVFDRELQVKEYKEALAASQGKTDELYRQIGELTAQLNWAKKKSKQVGLQVEAWNG
jgi:transposase-like protein